MDKRLVSGKKICLLIYYYSWIAQLNHTYVSIVKFRQRHLRRTCLVDYSFVFLEWSHTISHQPTTLCMIKSSKASSPDHSKTEISHFIKKLNYSERLLQKGCHTGSKNVLKHHKSWWVTRLSLVKYESMWSVISWRDFPQHTPPQPCALVEYMRM